MHIYAYNIYYIFNGFLNLKSPKTRVFGAGSCRDPGFSSFSPQIKFDDLSNGAAKL